MEFTHTSLSITIKLILHFNSKSVYCFSSITRLQATLLDLEPRLCIGRIARNSRAVAKYAMWEWRVMEAPI
jgi:hypothetical protein